MPQPAFQFVCAVLLVPAAAPAVAAFTHPDTSNLILWTWYLGPAAAALTLRATRDAPRARLALLGMLGVAYLGLLAVLLPHPGFTPDLALLVTAFSWALGLAVLGLLRIGPPTELRMLVLAVATWTTAYALIRVFLATPDTTRSIERGFAAGLLVILAAGGTLLARRRAY